MQSMKLVLVLTIVAGLSTTARAGIFDLDILSRLGARKSARQAGRAPGCCGKKSPAARSQPREVIAAPCVRTVHTYQRRQARPLGSAPSGCAKPAARLPGCKEDPASALSAEQRNARAIAGLIFQSQTACYARQRRAAIHAMGDRYNCAANPEILVAFVYGLNDADESVRAKSADEIGDQVRRNPACCAREVIAALKVALGDCDPIVRREARQALAACGFDVARSAGGNCAKPARDCVPGTPAKPQYEGKGTQKAAKTPGPLTGPDAPGVEKISAVAETGSEAGTRGLTGLLKHLKKLHSDSVGRKLKSLLPRR